MLSRRFVGAALALACALCAPAQAAPHPPEAHPPVVAMMSVDDVLRAMRCPPPFGCKEDVPPAKRKKFRRK